MTTRVPVARPQQTIGDVLEYISSSPGGFDTLEYVYVLDDQGKLAGLLPIEELFRASSGASVADLLPAMPMVTVLLTTDQEHTAYLALEHKARALPVVDDSNRFLGAVPSRAILAIIHKEVQEDLLHPPASGPLAAHWTTSWTSRSWRPSGTGYRGCWSDCWAGCWLPE